MALSLKKNQLINYKHFQINLKQREQVSKVEKSKIIYKPKNKFFSLFRIGGKCPEGKA